MSVADITINITSAAGPPGPAGPQGTPGAGVNWQGAWSAQVYAASDGVQYNGSSYIANDATTAGDVPGVSAKWDLWVEKGDQGDAGPQGPQGDPGTGVSWQGVWSAQAYVANDGVSYNGSSYIANDATLAGDVPGVSAKWDLWVAKGDPGSNGADGANGSDGKTILYGAVNPTTEGVDGDFYINTAANTIFGPKAGGIWPAGTSLVGPQGPAGTNGADGTNGTDGKTILYGAVNPTTEGVDGDFYINTVANTIFGPKAGGTWPAGTSLVGPQGPQGLPGAGISWEGAWSAQAYAVNDAVEYNGSSYVANDTTLAGDVPGVSAKWDLWVAKGDQGDAGNNGADGADGKTILYGAVNPTTEGVDGDFYINTAANTIFGPKAGGTWPAGTSLVGPQGPAGTNGADGTDGKTILYGAVNPTTEGVDGDFYINTAANTIFGPKAGGTWPAGTSLVGPQGPAGNDGADGVNVTITVAANQAAYDAATPTATELVVLYA